jgi:hypothetical protein
MATEKAEEQLSIARHPDIIALRERYEQASETPLAWLVEGLTFLGGTYAAISSWVMGFNASEPALTASNLIVGLTVTLLALGFATNYARTHVLSWVTPLLGAWLIIAPWVVRGVSTTTRMIVSNAVTGGCIVALGLAVTGIAMMRRHG